MTRFLQKMNFWLRRRHSNQSDDSEIEAALQSYFRSIPAGPETEAQWLRLQQAITLRGPKAAPQRREWVPRLVLGAAAVIALVGALWYFLLLQSTPEKFISGKGEQRELLLDDGSYVTLSYATTLDVPRFGNGEDRRILLSGEAYFRVQAGGNPFIVSTELAEVKVVGTEFNVRLREGKLEVSVMKGIVDVSASRNGAEKTFRLSRLQRATWSKNNFPDQVEDLHSLDYPGWLHGKLFLESIAFSEACREIEMRFDVNIRIKDAGTPSQVVSGILDAGTARSAVAALCELTGKKFNHDGQNYTIY